MAVPAVFHRMPLAEFRDNPKAKPHRKYRNNPVNTLDGRFDSQAELRHWNHLKLRQLAREISDLKRQVTFVLLPAFELNGKKYQPMRYIADMTYIENGALVVCDVKGAVTPEYRIKRRLMASVHGIEIKEIRA